MTLGACRTGNLSKAFATAGCAVWRRTEWEREIDRLVYAVYGLTPEEIKIVDLSQVLVQS